MKKIIRLTESELYSIVKTSVDNILKEYAIQDVNGNDVSVHGNDPMSWEKMAELRGKRCMDANHKMDNAEDEVMKSLYKDDAETHIDGFLRDKIHANDLR